MRWHLAEIWEAAADAVPDAPALIHGSLRRTWGEYEERAARIAAGLAAAGLTAGAKVALYAYNCNEYLEAQFGVFKIHGVPINVNYRYTEDELVYLLNNADVEALVYQATFAPKVSAIRARIPKVRLFLEIDDGAEVRFSEAQGYETFLSRHMPHPRSPYDEEEIYMLYTGGTTGMPKGVMYRQGDFALGLMTMNLGFLGEAPPPSRAALGELFSRIRGGADARVSLAACPLMHGTGLWLGVFSAHNLGGCAVTLQGRHFDPVGLWEAVEREKITDIALVGDAFAKPMLLALEAAAAAGRPFDVTSLKRIVSSGVMFSREVKEGLLRFADAVIIDGMGSTEGSMGLSVVSRTSPPVETARFQLNPTSKVFNERDEEVKAGSVEIGMIGNSGMVPIGYYKDPEKSARTFRVVNGVRYSFPGDFAKVSAEGEIILLGRGSGCINTGGEKVFPEEVEEALKAHPAVRDCLVVGVPDDRFGQRVTAVFSVEPGSYPDEAQLLAFARTKIADYKLPRRLVVVDAVSRAANGKADYVWARRVATEAG